MSGGIGGAFIAGSSQVADGAVSEAKLAAEACSAAKMKKEGTATHVLTSNGAGAVPSYQAPAIGAQDYYLIERVALGAATNSVAFSSIGSYKQYKLYFKFKATAALYAKLRLNADAGANYNCELLALTNSATFEGFQVTSGTDITIPTGNIATPDCVFGELTIINDSDLFYRTFQLNATWCTDTAGHKLLMYGGFWKSSSALTSINFTTSASTFLAGSSFALYGMD